MNIFVTRTLPASVIAKLEAVGNVEVFSADHPALRDGWHTVERLGTAMWRWSNGNAALPVVSNGQPVVLEVQVGDTATYALMDMASEVRVAA